MHSKAEYRGDAYKETIEGLSTGCSTVTCIYRLHSSRSHNIYWLQVRVHGSLLLLVNITNCLTYAFFHFFFLRMRTAEHLPSGWPFESSHYKSTFRTPQLGYCRHSVYPSSVHRKNNPHAALIDPYQYPDKVITQFKPDLTRSYTTAALAHSPWLQSEKSPIPEPRSLGRRDPKPA